MNSVQNRSREEVFHEVRNIIVGAVNLQHLDLETMTPETSLRDGGLELDSIDILEVVVAVEQHFNVKVGDAETGNKYFRTIGGVTDFVLLRA